MKGLLLAVGGTGGHIYPAVALGEAVKQLWPDAMVAIAGNPGGREAKAAERYGFGFEPVRAVKMPKSATAMAGFPGAISTALMDGRRAIANVKPGAVVGFGGYVSFPTVAAALMSRCPVFLHEQNLSVGRANRTLARFATGIFASFEATARTFGPKAVYTGNPCRFDGKPAPSRAEAHRWLGLDPESCKLYVFGGSQGAASLNRAAVEFARMEKARMDVQIFHLAGQDKYEETAAAYREIVKDDGIRVEVRPYLEEMEYAYAAADLVVCRAGATTLTEVACFGVPAVLVPYPFATEGHQEENARHLTDAGAAILVKDSELNGEKLRNLVARLIEAPNELRAMAAQAKKMYKANSAGLMAERLRPLLAPGQRGTVQ